MFATPSAAGSSTVEVCVKQNGSTRKIELDQAPSRVCSETSDDESCVSSNSSFTAFTNGVSDNLVSWFRGLSSKTTTVTGGPYVPPPVVNQEVVLCIGLFLYLLALSYPFLIIVVAYLVSRFIPYCFRQNDDANQRRKLFAQFAQQENLPEKFKNIPPHIELEESYWINERGMALSTSIMTPKDKQITAVVCHCHGYTDHASFAHRIENQRFIDHGIAVVTIEYEGHGRSDGPLGYIDDWDTLVDDVSGYFAEVSTERFQGKPIFLMGESMGGAVAYSVYNRIPHIFRGVVFVCPMCKISDEMLPPQFVIDTLKWLIGPSGTGSLLGLLPVAPASNAFWDVTHKDKSKLEMSSRCPTNYCRNPRLATARELLEATQRISSSLSDFEAPFLVVHGRDDKVTDPELSLALYKESKSKDKSIRLYGGMWHSLICGEPDENVNRVFSDIVGWIKERAVTSKPKPRSVFSFLK